MQFGAHSGEIHKTRAGCIVIGVHNGRKLSNAAQSLDEASDGYLSKILRRGDLSEKIGTTLLLQDVQNIRAQRVLLVRIGQVSQLSPRQYLRCLTEASSALQHTNARDALICLSEIKVEDRDLYWRCRQMVAAMRQQAYRFERLKAADCVSPLQRVGIYCADQAQRDTIDRALLEGTAIAEGIDLAKDLGNLPGNLCTPSKLVDEAKALIKEHSNLKLSVLEESDMTRLQMGSLLSVTQGSEQPAKFIILNYTEGESSQAPIVLIGKGVTFDSGGISLKSGAGMDEMKFDMCGGASVFGVMKALSILMLKINVIGIIPATENMPDARAVKPGDIVISMSGQTIEILNTDAEGRLILCDALTHAEQYQPDEVIDIATLTGACVVALGNHSSGLFSNDDNLAAALLAAGESTDDRAWRLPIGEEYQEQLKSNFADMANVGGRAGGAITAACFLSRFAQKFRWAHLDIAGTAWLSGAKKGATGRPVSLLMQHLLNRAS